MAEVTAILRYARISPQKCRLVADTVRGKEAGNALNTLKFMPKKGAKLVYKVLGPRSRTPARTHGLDVDDLKVSRIHVDAAPMFKRFAARAKGRGARIIKRNSHITVAVSDGKKD